MKLVFTVNRYKPSLDGVQFVTSYLAEGLAAKGHEVVVITSRYTRVPSSEKEEISGVKVVRKKMTTVHTFHRGNKKDYQKFILEETKNADCLINIGSQSPFTDWCFKVLDDIKIPKLLYLHSIWNFKMNRNDFINLKRLSFKLWANIRWYIYYCTNKKTFKKYDTVIQLHEKDESYDFFLKRYGITSRIIENAADNCFFEKKVNTNFKKPFENYLIYVANYIDGKNQILAIREFLKSNIDKKVGLVLIGSIKNNYYNYLVKEEKKLRKKLNLSKNEKPIIMLTNVDRNLISSYVSNSLIYLLSSKEEKFPVSIIESMAASVPFISTDVGIVKYLPGGVVSNQEDISYWIEKLYYDDELRSDLGRIGNKYASKHMRIKDKVDQLEKIILDLTGGEVNDK